MGSIAHKLPLIVKCFWSTCVFWKESSPPLEICDLKLTIGRVQDNVLTIQSSKETKSLRKDTNIAIIWGLANDESRRNIDVIIITMDFRIKSHIQALISFWGKLQIPRLFMALSHNLYCHAKLSTIMSNPVEFISFMIFSYYFIDNFMSFITIDMMETQSYVFQQKIMPFQPIPSCSLLLKQMLGLLMSVLHYLVSGKLPTVCKEALIVHRGAAKHRTPCFFLRA